MGFARQLGHVENHVACYISFRHRNIYTTHPQLCLHNPETIPESVRGAEDVLIGNKGCPGSPF